ncbi:MAG TPA: SIMPL domain-containing protein [Acidobacteriota bacterium]
MRKFNIFISSLLFFSHIAAAQENPRIPLIYTTGEAKLEVPPDMVVISLGVTTQAKTVAEAREQNSVRMQAVVDAIKQLNIPTANILTTRFNVSPQYDYQEKRNPPRIVGYNVTNQVTVKLEQIEKVSQVVDASLAAGANTVNSLEFTLKDPRGLRRSAYTEAVRDARNKAEALAAAAGVQLGKIYLIRESGGPVPIRRAYETLAMASKTETPTPIESGQVTIQINVEIQFEIKQ